VNDQNLKRGLTLSLFAHLAVFALMFGAIPQGCTPGCSRKSADRNGANSDQEHKQAEQESRDIVPKQVAEKEAPVEISLIDNKELRKLLKKKPKIKDAVRECEGDLWFAGIGVSYQALDDGLISEVFKGYPAEKAGIRVGDKLLTPLRAIRGDAAELGKAVIIKINRNGNIIDFIIVREKICIKEMEKK
jgi:predicted metalloprotease with PDZ domain